MKVYFCRSNKLPGKSSPKFLIHWYIQYIPASLSNIFNLSKPEQTGTAGKCPANTTRQTKLIGPARVRRVEANYSRFIARNAGSQTIWLCYYDDRGCWGQLPVVCDIWFRLSRTRGEAATAHENLAVHPGSLRITAYLFAPSKQTVVHTRNYPSRKPDDIASTKKERSKCGYRWL